MCPNMCVSVQKCTFPERRCAVCSVQRAAAPEVGASFEGLRDRLHQPNHCTEYTTQYTLDSIRDGKSVKNSTDANFRLKN